MKNIKQPTIMKQQLQFVSFEQAKKLKELGFNWKCNAHYFDDGDLDLEQNDFDWNSQPYWDGKAYTLILFSAPTVALALKWFRDVKKIKNTIQATENIYYGTYYKDGSRPCTINFVTYDEAENALLDELLKLKKHENN
jgi:hypothetical protein